ncbi:PWWP domain-containing protein 5 [Aegilops tauschii subsp. strangulata]|nr:uncharacterized protein LOC109762342 [Aegilops tauschii subsp. strangulata]
MIWLSGMEGGVDPEGRDELPLVDASTDGEAMAQGSFGEADFDAMMVESGGLQGEEVGSSLAQVQNIAADTAEISDPAVPQHDAEAESNEDGQRVRYRLPPLDKDGFRVSDLVWAKLQGRPWWPGAIFDPSDASELALEHQKEGHHLVAFFGDGSFAWCQESQLKPFMDNCLEMEKQGNSDAFTSAVNSALQELSTRILTAASCSCLPEYLSENGLCYLRGNSGLKAGVTCSKVNQAEILQYFSPEHLLHYMKSLALSPCQGGVLQDLVIACSQLMSFYRSKGYGEIASFQSGSAWAEDVIDTTATNEVQPSHVKPKRGRGRPRKRKPDDNIELAEGRPIVKPQNEPIVHNNIGETECGEVDIYVKKPAKRRRVQRRHGVDTKDLLSGMAASTEMSMIGKTEGDRSEEWKFLPCPKEETTDHMQDAYWSGLSLHTVSTHSLKGASGKTRPIRRRRPTRRTCAPSSDLSSPVQNMQPETLDVNRKIEVIKRSIIHVDEKMVHDVNPTALVLCFGKSIALPSEMDFIRMFSRYGPLKETETEVHKNTNTAKVVFRKRVDAERAFSVAGNFGSFGPSLRSFRLANMPFSLTTELNYPKLRSEDGGMEIPACRVSGVALDSAQIGIVDKADKGETVGNPSVEHTEMVKLAGQYEGNTERALHAGGRNEESPDVLSDTMQTGIVDDTPKHKLVCVHGVVEASEDTMEVDNTDETREETSMPRDLRAQAFTGYVQKQSVGDEYTLQGIEGSTVEMPVGEARKFSCC